MKHREILSVLSNIQCFSGCKGGDMSCGGCKPKKKKKGKRKK